MERKNLEEIELTQKELAKYSRHIIIPEVGLEGQKKLKNARVLIIGAGGLGSPALLYLAAAGVGTIGLIDFDVVDDSNLQRQVLFSMNDIGRLKVEAARDRVLSLNPYINVITYNEKLSSQNALEIFKDYDVVADGTDNFPTRYLVNDACVLLGIPNVYASIYRFDGQASVFNYKNGPNYRDLYPTPPPPGLVPSCAEGGVLGVLPGLMGCIQTNEVIKIILGVGDVLSGRLFTFDALGFTTRVFKVHKDPNNPLTGDNPTQTKLIDYDFFCGIPQLAEKKSQIKEITPSELQEWLDEKRDIQVIDVREQDEYDLVNIGAKLIPLSSLESHIDEIDRNRPVVVHCKAGGRSARAIDLLTSQYGFDNLYNLKGGIIGYIGELKLSLPVY
ncbi:MAG: molybdopterin-synthase adenylyltransferase MoeB [Chitinophagales bacterium]|nr:molybdopterin-synthase adenylyltransferase MoeB [Chitinophagales bacterium]